MGRVVRRETRKRGFFGRLFIVLFYAFNLFMGYFAYKYWSGLAVMEDAASGAESAGRVIGGTLASGALIFVWLAGAVILGLFALLTRGQKTIVEEID